MSKVSLATTLLSALTLTACSDDPPATDGTGLTTADATMPLPSTSGPTTGDPTTGVPTTGDPGTVGGSETTGETGTSTSGPELTSTGLTSSTSTTSADTDGEPMNACKVAEDAEDAPPPCEEKAPANAFAPAVQWTWTAPPTVDPGALASGSFATPLVGNFTDDNGDGAIDLCDTPDVLVTAISTFEFGGITTVLAGGYVHMLAGDTGVEELKFPTMIDAFVYPAFGDLDGDALPDLVTADIDGHLMAFAHDGTVEWTSPVVGGYRTTFASTQCTAIAIYDLNADGAPEILFGWEVYDNSGNLLFGDPTNAAEWDGQYWCVTPTAADLDGDGTLEVVMGHEAYRADGTLYYKLPNFKPAHPQIANLDADPEPEVFLTNADGITVLEHTGAIKYGPLRPTDPTPSPNCWGKPAVVHDFDGDDIADIAAATCTDYTVYTVGAQTVTPKWSNNVQDLSGLATATAFDFLGDGVAEAIYADETQIYVFDGETGLTNLTAPRQSGTLIEYPIVADIDNDGSAEILYVSNYTPGTSGPTLTALRDAEERWIPARRIWNQYSYHVTNVREDGTVPQEMKNNWQLLNTFRTNSQVENGGLCDPIPG
ncbi:VCBS repeat-containing protein [Nannocystis sp. SCPEA4]|uniref:FG-GAP repeat domain-containing protein n=1 Tax=Nannocystis sp. SCPEA4 TaxID=2996787 RepID=UPI00226E1822|nr:VCBS repeat-containing protein [Nannocystis sp. SCPEA4]MCY1057621.1 VCBS repeat-containing protein [Nannocystis sp. SCPEA4]